MMQRGRNGPPDGLVAAAPAAATDEPAWRVAAATIGLSLAGVLSPIAVAMVAATNALLWRPLVASALVALLVLAPAGVGVVTALVGLRRVASLAAQAGWEAEHAVLRVLVVAVLFGYALALTPFAGSAADCVPLVAPWLVAAWAMLLCVLLWPSATPARRYGAMMLDIALLSGFLHLGGSDVAGWYPLFLVASFYTGLRFGVGALVATAIVGVLGFAAVVLSTETWWQQPALAAGLIAGLAVLPACIAGAIRGIAAAQAKAAHAEAERQRTLLLIADTLRGPPATARASAGAASPLKDVMDFAALESGTFAPPLETFDLRLLIRHGLSPAQAKAAERGATLRWRIDPRLPYRLRGQAQAFARILSGLADHAIEVAPGANVRVAIDAGDRDARRVRLHVSVDGLGATRDVELRPGEVPLALRLVQRLIDLADGAFAIDRQGQRTRLMVTLPLAIEAGAAGPVLDLQRRPVLLVTADDELARALAEPLAAWNAEPRWPGDADEALAELARPRDGPRPIAIVDGRDKLLSALGLAHHAARLGADAPFVLLLAAEAQIASLVEVDEGELDGFIPAPVTEQLLANAVHGLPLEPVRPLPHRDDPPRPAPERQPAGYGAKPAEAERITAIAAHPKFVPEPAVAVDARAIERLRALGGGPGFLREMIETFLADAQQIMQRLEKAATAADAAGFARGLVALHRAAGHLGGAQLCELATSLQHLTASELTRRGPVHLQRLDSEIDRLAVALMEYVPASEARRP